MTVSLQTHSFTHCKINLMRYTKGAIFILGQVINSLIIIIYLLNTKKSYAGWPYILNLPPIHMKNVDHLL